MMIRGSMKLRCSSDRPVVPLDGTSSTRFSFVAEPASKEPGVDESMIGGFASKVKKATDAFERH